MSAVLDVERACDRARDLLVRGLSPMYRYHSVWHTESDVVPAALRLAALEGITGEPLLLLKTAAWYHDLGCLVQRPDHEAIGVGMAAALLPEFGYSAGQIQTIAGLIFATRLPQAPRTPLEAILADADLDVLGREDFWERNRDLRAEWAAFGMVVSDAEWYQIQLKFVGEHRYFTAAGRRLRDDLQAMRLVELRDRLAALDAAAAV